MEALSRTESSGIAAATAVLDLALMSAVESLALQMILDAGKSLFWLLCVLGFSPSGGDLFDEGCEIIKGFPLSSLGRGKDEPVPENKDDGESDEEDEDEEEVGGEQDDDGGEEDYSGDEGNEEDEDEDEIEANGGGGGSEDDDDEDEDDDDDDDEDGDDEEDEGDEDEDEDQPPTKKRK